MRWLGLAVCLAVACAPAPEGLQSAQTGPGPRVSFDVFHRPLPEIPLPNDFATRFDGLSPTLRRVNASIEVAPTRWEKATRAELDKLSGWGTLAPITASFSEPLDLQNIVARHKAPADTADDVLYVFDITESSPEFCQPQLLDLGQGHFPLVADTRTYYPDEPHGSLEQLQFEQEEEDLNHDGKLDPGEDTDMDGVLDHPNTIDGRPSPFEVIGFYERETNTLIAKPLYPMREATTYAVVLTTRLVGLDGNPVRSPFTSINHLAQTRALTPLKECLARANLKLEDVGFTWSFTTQSVTADYIAVRDGLYGKGTLARLADQFPAKLASLEEARKRTSAKTNTKIVSGEQFLSFGTKLLELYGGSQTAGTKQILSDFLSFVDFYASASFISPQFFPRYDAEGKFLPLYEQTFKLNAALGEATIRPESVPMLLSVPKDRKGPAPVVIFMHGHGSSKVDALLMMGPMARFGLATIGMDAVSHGIGLGKTEEEIITEIVKPYGIDPLARAILKGRALDQNGDGLVDSGVDYFTGYVIHTRDTVRQTAIDLMQLIRTLRSFDGKQKWDFDVNRDGAPDLAGDFDGDGKVDLGGPDVPIYVSGASLGGILSSLVGGLDPEISAIVPILPGGYLSEIGTRSDLRQVKDPLVLRMLGPLMLVHPDADGNPSLFQMLPDLGRSTEVKVATLPSKLTPGAIAVVTNLKTGEWRCGRVQPNGHLRLAVSSDQGDRLKLELFDRELPTRPREGCEPQGVSPVLTIDSFSTEFTFQTRPFAAGSPLQALGDGFGMRRGSPELRRLLNLAQVGLEAADPANFAPFYEQTRTLTYGDGKSVATRSMMVPMTGDPGVPIATAAALLRAAGHLDYRHADPKFKGRYAGMTAQQVLIDTGFVEGVERTRRHLDAAGNPVLMDVDVLQSVASADDGFGVPRLDPPIRLLRQSKSLGGTVGALFPMMSARGDHSFPVPDPAQPFDLGTLLINIFASYLGSGGETMPLEACMERSNCSWFKPVPPPP
ncbi:MAG: hypothetical protein H6Q89_2735 [Myxococcaceae bacterium]|nr:hypothetical protein [Myxococcaceae bacterium]